METIRLTENIRFFAIVYSCIWIIVKKKKKTIVLEVNTLIHQNKQYDHCSNTLAIEHPARLRFLLLHLSGLVPSTLLINTVNDHLIIYQYGEFHGDINL